jgi:putative DNA primase/helicase
MSEEGIPLAEARRRTQSAGVPTNAEEVKAAFRREGEQDIFVSGIYAGAPEYSDEDVALNFAERYAGRLCYVEKFGGWNFYDGRKWHELEPTRLAQDLMRETCRDFSRKASDDRKDKIAQELASKKTSSAAEFLARSDRRLAATVDQWDRNPWLLNCPSVTIDLEKKERRSHRAEDFLTRMTAVDPGTECPTWLRFLERATNGDEQLQVFLQRIAGYVLTGSTREHALFFLYGTGANGKSVFVNTLLGVLGDYGLAAPIETFTANRNEQHPTELARLRGRRLVAAIETEEGKRWSESRIKTLTGGDRIAARFMRQDFFEFTPEFKLLIAGNHRPALRGVDEGIRRRMNLIPFTVTIPEDERDDRLAEKLRQEWPGILGWAIEGCYEWQGEGLSPPEAVRAATSQYLEDEDALGQWLKERCSAKEGFYATTAELFASWRKWAEKAGEFVGSQKRFSQLLQDRGFERKRQSMTGRAGFAGITIRIEYDDESPAPEEVPP